MKYFVDHWQRAKQFAELAGFLQADEAYMHNKSGAFPSKINDGRTNETDLMGIDIFMQEHFFHCYNLIYKEKRHF